ncbi:type I restriction enzyme HsdR N-terminal domain-containing protein [Oceanobacillus zhaokaii]|nr:type I restriction enzyme HsdR N-terminal domain-containing protein [Oceanobacillus zhaokaii]
MSELLVALDKVKPDLVDRFQFPEDNIQGYGRVPVQMGTKTIWADFVLYYYDKFYRRKIFCVIEVKDCKDSDIDFAVPQAESYAQRLNSPFFCCTNGNIYSWYMTGSLQGDSIKLEDCPTLPAKRFLKKSKIINATPYLFEAITNFETNIKLQKRIYEDSEWHNDATNELHNILTSIEKINDKDLVIFSLKKYTMKSRGKTELLNNIKNNYASFKNLVAQLKATNVPIEIKIQNTTGKNSKYGIEKGGLFFITQLLSALYPMEYTVIEPNVINAMKRFHITDIDLKNETAQDYLYFNQICLDLFPLFENPFNFNLSYVHNFLWHYEAEYFPNKTWD